MVLLDEQQPLTFRGGIALASVATTVLIMGVIDSAPAAAGGPTALQRVARHPTATWVGARSYSIYLWHWPVILLVALDNPSAPGTLSHLLTRLWCVVVTLALADLTYRFVEGPFRTLGFRAVGARMRDQVARLSVPTRRGVAALVTVVALVVAGIVVTAPDQSETARMLAANEAAAEADEPTAPTPGSAVNASPSAAPSSVGSAGPSGVPTGRNATFTMPSGTEIDAYGDSIMVGSLAALRYYFPGIRIDAKSNRRWSDAVTQVTERGAANRRAVVLAFGTNAGVDVAGAEKVLDELGPNRMIVLVNVMGPFSRIEQDNAKLEAIARGRSNVAIADWASAVRAHPEQVQSDRIHPTIKGAHLFSKAVRQALADLSERNTGTPVVLKELPIP
jgi:hypothetical protein